MIQTNVGITWSRIYSLAVASVGKPAVYISNGNDMIEAKDIAAWDWLMSAIDEKYSGIGNLQYDLTSAIINSDMVFFDTKEEMYAFYSLFEHHMLDSGPIYACAFDQSGCLLTENT